MKKYNVTLVLSACLLIVIAKGFATDEVKKFPFIGKVKVDNVNVRSGGSQNFEILSKMNSNDFIYVVEEQYNWYKIKLPRSAYCYIFKNFVDANGMMGTVKASNVNLRARPNKESSIMGQLKNGQAVTIINQDMDGWYQIEPPDTCNGWIRADLVNFYSSDIEKFQQKEKTSAATDDMSYSEKLNMSPPFVVQGKVEKVGFTFGKKSGSHKLIKDGKLDYYLKSDLCNLRNYEGKFVFVSGSVSQGNGNKPVINVERIEEVKRQ
jgi:uncharacterized protein YgiM (DUF1202 family)